MALCVSAWELDRVSLQDGSCHCPLREGFVCCQVPLSLQCEEGLGRTVAPLWLGGLERRKWGMGPLAQGLQSRLPARRELS